jgi:hypothetical protein
MKPNFSVKSTTKSWSLYNAFAEELLLIGYNSNNKLISFNKIELEKQGDMHCIYISDVFMGKKCNPKFSFGHSRNCINLETNWEEAINYAKEFYKERSNIEYRDDAAINFSLKTVFVKNISLSFDEIDLFYSVINQ